MAFKPTIYNLRITLADTGRDYYDRLNLTVAQHPSETLERMMARGLAFCFKAKSDTCWAPGRAKFNELPVSAFQFQWGRIKALATLVKCSVDLSITISGHSLCCR